MHEFASSLSSATDLSATLVSRTHEIYKALEGVVQLGARATHSTAGAVAIIDGDSERSLATFALAPYSIARTIGASGVTAATEGTLCMQYSELSCRGCSLPIDGGQNATICVRGLHLCSGTEAVVWIAREGSQPYSTHDVETFESTVALVERELGLLARLQDIIIQRERATVEVAELHAQMQGPYALYHAVAKHLPGTAVLIFDSELRVHLYEGRHAIPALLSSAPDNVSTHVIQYFPPEAASKIDAACKGAFMGNQQLFEIQAAERVLEISVGPLQDVPSMNAFGLAITRDVTENRRKQEQSTAYGTRLQALVQNLDDGILVEDENRQVQICSNRLCDIMRLDLPSEVHIDTDALALTSKMASICFIPEAFEESTAQLVDGNLPNRRELIYLADMRIIERDYSPLSVHGRAMGHLWVYRDVTQREQSKDLLQRQADQLRALSLVDELTGLYNRRGFLTLATQQLKLCDRTLRPALVVFVDLDGMKRINDELGHEFGDQALTETANTMRQCFRYSDVLARLGGDEFVALAIDAAEDTATAIQARLYEKLAELNAKPGRQFELQFSVGIAPYDPSRAEMVEEVLARADSQMYEQKRARKAART